jgi:hypothetical protein
VALPPYPLSVILRKTLCWFLVHAVPQTVSRNEKTGRDRSCFLQETETAKLRAGEPTSGVFPRGAKPGEAAERGYRAISTLFLSLTGQSLGYTSVSKMLGGKVVL